MSLKYSLLGASLGQAYSRPALSDLCDGSEVAVATLPKPSQDVIFRIKERVKSLPLKHDERAKAAGIINEFIDSFISYLKKCEERPYFKEVTKMTTGSYYEFVKVSNCPLAEVMGTAILSSAKYKSAISLFLHSLYLFAQLTGGQNLITLLTLLKKCFCI